MTRPRLTQIFPGLLPLRKKQRLLAFYAKMRLDGLPYARTLRPDDLPHRLFSAACPLYNHATGQPMRYQENKVFNLKLAAATLNGLLLRPGEVFSFWQLVRHADDHTPYREGLVVRDDQLQTVSGGGMCELSNFLFWLLLHAPTDIVERHGHRTREFPEPPAGKPTGVDATVAEGWLDLKMRSAAPADLQIRLHFSDDYLHGAILSAAPAQTGCQIYNGDITYVQRGGQIYEEAQVIRRTGQQETLLYTNRCAIAYPLPANVPIII